MKAPSRPHVRAGVRALPVLGAAAVLAGAFLQGGCGSSSSSAAECDGTAFLEWDGATHTEAVSEVDAERCSPRVLWIDTAGSAVGAGHSVLTVQARWNHTGGTRYDDHVTVSLGWPEGPDIEEGTAYPIALDGELRSFVAVTEDSSGRTCGSESGLVRLTSFPDVGGHVEGRYEVTAWDSAFSTAGCPAVPHAGTFRVLHEH